MGFSPARIQRPLIADVALVPAFLPAEAADRGGTVYVVVDVIRATTTLCVLFERGCRRVLVASGIEAARRARGDHGPSMLLAGENGGLAPTGFDFGNSPRELAAADVAGRDVIFATTNGTRAMRACLGGSAIYAGAFRNADAVAARALAAAAQAASDLSALHAPQTTEAQSSGASEAELRQPRPDVVIVCSGRGGQPAYDDTICAGYLVERLLALADSGGIQMEQREGARIARACATAALATRTTRDALAASDAAQAIERVELADDLAWCADVDAATVVPAVTLAEGPEGLIVVEAAGTAASR